MIKRALVSHPSIKKECINVPNCLNYCLIYYKQKEFKRCEHLGSFTIIDLFSCKIECTLKK